MKINQNIEFALSAADLDAIKNADKSLVKLDAKPLSGSSSSEFSAWNCPYKECRPRSR